MKLEKKIGLAGGAAIVVGGVIGMGAYALVPVIVQQAGPAYWLAVVLALAVSLISVLPLIQIASAMPVAGGGYMYASRLISPLLGTLTSCWGLVGGACSVSLISVGLADYFSVYLPVHLSAHVLAMLIVLVFYTFYLSGIKLLSALQVLLSVQLLAALLVYALPVLYAHPAPITLGLPVSSSFWMAVILSMNIALGFQIIIELGEEMKDPQRNIPLALLLGTAIILLIYLLILLAYDCSGAQPPVNLLQSGQAFFSPLAARFIELGMISAGLTSYNGAAITLPREIFAMSRDRTLPACLSKLNRQGSPATAVTAFFGLVMGMLALGQLFDSLGVIGYFFGTEVITFYGFMTIMGIMLLTVVLSVAALRLPHQFPHRLQTAYVRFPQPLLILFVVVAIAASLMMIAIICTKWIVPAVYALFTLLVVIYFYSRKQKLQKEGILIGTVFQGMDAP